MTSETRENLPMPVNMRHWSEQRGLILSHTVLLEALHTIEPQLTERETERIEYHLTELLENLVKGSGHLPKDVVPTPGKGEMTHILNGRLLRREGIWIGLLFEENLSPLQIISVNRATPDQLVSIIGGGQFRGAARSNRGFVPRFHKH